jgi:hypothetical protein
MAYQRKTKTLWFVYVNYGNGWEHELTEDTWKEAREQLKTYRANCPQYPCKAVARRMKLVEDN